jgi:hypothetical protein
MHCKTEPQRDDVEFYSGRMAQHYCLSLMSFGDVRRGEKGEQHHSWIRGHCHKLFKTHRTSSGVDKMQ